MSLAEDFGPLRHGGVKRVSHTQDFQRILDLPRRVWQEDPNLDRLVDLMTRWLKFNPKPCDPLCEGCSMLALKPAQAQALRECHDLGGGFLPLRPGAGKTAVSLLLPTVMKARKPLLVVPASLRADTFARSLELARHWRIIPCKVLSYETLAHPKHVRDLEEFAPDLIIWDEAHESGKVCRKRTGRYLKGNPECRFVAMTGTPASRSLRELDFPLRSALRRNAPLPHDLNERIAWQLALDAKVPTETRLDPGALLTLPGAEGDTPLAAARAGWRKRFTETPGIVSTGEDIPPMRLVVRSVEPPVPPAIRDAILKMRETWCTPAGDSFKLALDMWRYCKSLGLGLHSRWDPPAPPEWRLARSTWYKAANEKLGPSRTLDSYGQLQDGLLDGSVKDPELLRLYQAWLDVKDSFIPRTVWHWVDDSALKWAAEWMAEGPGIVWVSDKAFGERLSEITGVPYFAEQGMSKCGKSIITHAKHAEVHAICSIQSCGTGKNLFRWNRNLITNPPTTGKSMKQLIMRTWRDGQEASEVTVDVVLVCREAYEGLLQAFRDAQMDPEAHPLIHCDRIVPSIEELVAREDKLWDNVGV